MVARLFTRVRSRLSAAALAGAVLGGLALSTAGAAMAGHVTVHIEGVRSDSGLVRIGVFDRSAAFPRMGRVAGADVAARQGVVIAVIPGLAPGEYAIAIHHDEDGDGEFDTDFIGLPQEGYGFSNDAPVRLGPPDFEEAAFEVGADGAVTALRVRY